MDTGRIGEPSLKFPHLGAIIARELGNRDSKVPDYVSMYTSTEGRRQGTAGFLGGRYNPMFLTDSMIPADIERLEAISDTDHRDRSELRDLLASSFTRRHSDPMFDAHNSAYGRVRGLMASDYLFDIDREPESVRDHYGPTQFGQQCLIARRLSEAGVPFVKVARAWWDSHGQNFETHRELCADLDHCMSSLLDDLKTRGLLDDTLVITLGEFGRTPKINGSLGRDHFASAWSCTLSGCGIRGGTVFGASDGDGQTVVDGEMNAGDLYATIFAALGIDHTKEYMVGSRPVPIADFDSQPCYEVLA
jgi:arylsulfatase A-like enzyme